MSVVPLVEDKLYALSNAYAVDGRVSWHPPGARGVAPMTVYLFRAEQEDLLVDTGLSVHREQVLADLSELGAGDQGRDFSLVTLRSGEFDSICNLAPIARTIPLSHVYSFHPDGIFWGDMHPAEPFDPSQGDSLGTPERSNVATASEIVLRGSAARQIRVLKPELRLLYTNWLYDEATRTLLTSDSFTWVIRPEGAAADRDWRVSAEHDRTTVEDIREHLLQTRFWWIADADLFDVRAQLESIFDSLAIDRIAPSFGCILEGREVVEHHVQMLDAVLAEQGRKTPLRPADAGAQRA